MNCTFGLHPQPCGCPSGRTVSGKQSPANEERRRRAIHDFLVPPVAAGRILPAATVSIINSLTRLSRLARYGFVTIAWFGTCSMRKREILFVRLCQKSSFSPPVDQRHQCAQDQNHHGHRNPKPWRSFGSDSGCSDRCIWCGGSFGRRVISRRRFGSVGDGCGGFRRWSGGLGCWFRPLMICWHSGSVSSG